MNKPSKNVNHFNVDKSKNKCIVQGGIMAGYKVEICGVNTSDLPLLKPAQSKELLVKINSVDPKARDTFKN